MVEQARDGLRLPWFTAALVVAAYASLRLGLNVEYERATWQQLYDLTAPLPFGHRVLVPLLSRPLVDGLGLGVGTAFLVFETLAAAALVWCLRGALRTRIEHRFATLWAIAALLWLAYPFLLRHRWPVYYPYDTASMAFMAGFLWLLLRQRLLAALALTAVAALNRETTLFYPLLAGLLLLRSLPPARLVGFAAALLAVHVAVRGGIVLALPDNPGSGMQFFVGGVPRVSNNMAWVLDPGHALLLLASLGFQPLFWFALSAWVPADLRRLRFAAWALFLAMSLVGNLYEPRVFGEMLVVMWIPVALAATGWLTRTAAPASADALNPGLAAAVDRLGLAALILPWAAATLILRFLVDWPAPGG